MPEAIFLSDMNVWGEFGGVRYVGPYALASQLNQNGYQSTVIDFFTYKENFLDYLSDFLSEKTLFLGFSSTFLSVPIPYLTPRHTRKERISSYLTGELQFSEEAEFTQWFAQLKQLLNAKAPNCKLLLGGARAVNSFFKPNIYKVFDHIILGSADKTILEYANHLKYKTPLKITDVVGLNLVDSSADNLNKTCPPTLWTKEFAVQKNEALPIEIARGCVFNCKFCNYDKKESFKKESDNLKQELIYNYEHFGTQSYHFCDDCFNDHPKKVEAVCNTIKSLPFKIEWLSYARVDVAVKFPHTLEMMIESGARSLFFGLESFNTVVARNAGKGTPTEKVKEFLLEFNKKYSNECLLEGSFITGLPGETEESLQETERWLLENPVLDFISIGSLNIRPYYSKLDKKVFDYADYARDPQKYGFTKISFNPHYWENSTMNSTTAEYWANRIKLSYMAIRPNGAVKCTFQYTHLRSLGFSKDEIFKMARSNQSKIEMQKISKLFSGRLENYFLDLRKANLPHDANPMSIDL